MSVYISEFAEATFLQGSQNTVARGPVLADQKLTLSGSTLSSAFNAKTKIIRVHTDEIISLVFEAEPGDGATATTSDMRLAADQTEYFEVKPGTKVAAISNT